MPVTARPVVVGINVGGGIDGLAKGERHLGKQFFDFTIDRGVPLDLSTDLVK
jgi:hypothetical protein